MMRKPVSRPLNAFFACSHEYHSTFLQAKGNRKRPRKAKCSRSDGWRSWGWSRNRCWRMTLSWRSFRYVSPQGLDSQRTHSTRHQHSRTRTTFSYRALAIQTLLILIEILIIALVLYGLGLEPCFSSRSPPSNDSPPLWNHLDLLLSTFDSGLCTSPYFQATTFLGVLSSCVFLS